MLTNLKVFIIKVKDKHYADMYAYYSDKADGFIKLGKYDEAYYCQELAAKYLIKQCDLVTRFLELV